MKTVASNGAHHSAVKVSDESTYRGSLVILRDMSYLNGSHVLGQISYKNEQYMPDVSNDDQEPNEILIDTGYPSDLLSTNEIFKKFDENVSEELNLNGLISSAVDPYHLVGSSELSIECGKHYLNRVTLTVTWVYEHPTLFCGGGEIKSENLKSGSKL
ncbi:unnamed protein product [Schistosoma mattheei]|uniref:Uncharacterized protein n=1 Tax=Schistosoma mattheei TaxID=31246 RepID=A0A183P6T4_9TREM|nr:unnamed protein product [Schistosoma mattheei]